MQSKKKSEVIIIQMKQFHLHVSIVFFSLIVLTSCYPPSPYAECHEAPLNSAEKSIKTELDQLTNANISITRFNYTRIKDQPICENREASYCIGISSKDSTLHSNSKNLHIIFEPYVKKIYCDAMDDTLRSLCQKIEISIYFLGLDPPSHDKKKNCFIYSKQALESFYGKSYKMKNGKISITKIEKTSELKFKNGICFYQR